MAFFALSLPVDALPGGMPCQGAVPSPVFEIAGCVVASGTLRRSSKSLVQPVRGIDSVALDDVQDALVFGRQVLVSDLAQVVAPAACHARIIVVFLGQDTPFMPAIFLSEVGQSMVLVFPNVMPVPE